MIPTDVWYAVVDDDVHLLRTLRQVSRDLMLVALECAVWKHASILARVERVFPVRTVSIERWWQLSKGRRTADEQLEQGFSHSVWYHIHLDSVQAHLATLGRTADACVAFLFTLLLGAGIDCQLTAPVVLNPELLFVLRGLHSLEARCLAAGARVIFTMEWTARMHRAMFSLMSERDPPPLLAVVQVLQATRRRLDCATPEVVRRYDRKINAILPGSLDASRFFAACRRPAYAAK